MKGRKKIVFFTVLAVALAALLVGIILTGGGRSESVEETMRNAVLHESDKISLFGLIDVNPSVISGFIVTAVLLICAAIIRIFVLPRFRLVPGKFQSVIEQAVEFFDNLGKSRSPRHNGFIGAYAFSAGVYIFFGTLFELFGVQVTGVTGNPVTLPAPLSDINGAISLGCLSYLVILGGGIALNGVRGLLLTLKDFSLPISMSFRLFGALLSGLLVTELVYYYTALSFVLPVLVGVLFTLLHAVIQAYVLTLLTTMFFGEVSERPEIREREIRRTDGEPETAAE